MIPKLIHQTWKTDAIPDRFKAWSATWSRHNPQWQRRHWSDRALLDFVAQAFPEFLELYCSFAEGVKRADAARYLLLYKFGGVYADIDTECLASLDVLLDEERVVLSLEPSTHWHPIAAVRGLPHLVFNGVIASPPGHPFWLHVLERLRANRLANNILDATGPCLLTASCLSYQSPKSLYVAPSTLFNGFDRWGVEPDPLAHEGRLARHYWEGTWLVPPTKRPVRAFIVKSVSQMAHWLLRGKYLTFDELRRTVNPACLTAAPSEGDNLAIFIPVRDAVDHLAPCLALIAQLDIPKHHIKLVFCEGDSVDGSWAELQKLVEPLRKDYRDIVLLQKVVHTRFKHADRARRLVQKQRRSGIAAVRNHMIDAGLSAADDWVLWMDVDVWSYPADIVSTLRKTGARIVAPHCVYRRGGTTFDLNTFITTEPKRDYLYYRWLWQGLYMPPKTSGRRLYMEDLRHSEVIPLHSVGGAMLLVDAALHRGGMRFPELPYEHLLETEGFGRLAVDLGVPMVGMPNVEVLHAPW